MKELSRIAEEVQASTTLAIDAMFKQMRADGVDVIGFGAGEPDFATPENIKEAGIAAIRADFTKYTPTPGIPELRNAVVQRMKTEWDLDYAPTEIVVASGAKHALYAALRILAEPGDEIILPAPYWVSYYELIRMVGATPVVVTATEEEHFKLTPEKLLAAVTERTKAVILNNPSNPTGMVYGREELEALARICVEEDLYIVADEIYAKLLYDGRIFTSVASLGGRVKERTILINGVSKTYAMTGWRIGYAAAPGHIAKLMSNYLSHSTAAPCSVAQKASAEAYSGPQETVEVMRSAFEERRNFLVGEMNKIPGVSCLLPEGAFYVMMNLHELLGRSIRGTVIRNADDFADAFLKYGLVATVPCTGFGAPEFVRWSYATSMENIAEGIKRLRVFLGE